MNILILGLGNPLMGDDGAGLAALARLKEELGQNGRFDFLDGGTQGVYLLPYLEDRECLLILDAVDFGGVPGETGEFNPFLLPSGVGPRLSPHQAGFEEALGLLDLLGRVPKRAVLVGIQPKSLDFGEPLSEEVLMGLPRVVEKSKNILRDWLEGKEWGLSRPLDPDRAKPPAR